MRRCIEEGGSAVTRISKEAQGIDAVRRCEYDM